MFPVSTSERDGAIVGIQGISRKTPVGLSLSPSDIRLLSDYIRRYVADIGRV